jgi:Holliday junction resolvasome RuvABC ATP-dependent DNA helicase subunit
MAQPPAEEDWLVLRGEIMETFTPGTPINETELFAGRLETIQKLQDIVLEPGRHAVIYGGRGIGKTSIANTFYRPLNRPTRPVMTERINCDTSDTFDSLWRKVFKRLKYTDSETWADQRHPQPITPDDVVTELNSFNAATCPIIILDEFDRIHDDNCKNLTADAVKALSDFTVNCTIIIVGVARSISTLISSHASITRALVQVQMERMTMDELEAILVTRATRLGITFDHAALWRITYLSAGLPFFTHSLGKHSALHAVKIRKRKIVESDVHAAMRDCLADVDYSMKESFVKATEKIYRKRNLFPQVLAACALADMDSLGRFTAANVEEPLTAILKKETKSSAFGFHLNELARTERGSILEKTGERRTYRFQFSDPRMQPYIVMQSLDSGIITNDVLSKFTIKPQRELYLST